jgi:hypothetical protein
MGNCVRHNQRDFLGCMGSDGSITTLSGIRFWPLLPNPADIRIEDIAHALSNQCRFAGHLREFYSVAEHSVRVSKHCRPEDALWGLLHDASEAYLSDVPAPMKELPEFEAYRAAERSLQDTIAVRFGLPIEQPRSVTQADRAVLGIEIRDLLRPLGSSQPGRPPQKSKLAITNPWQPRVAKARFLRRFRELCWKL